MGRLSSTQDPLNGSTASTAYTVDADSRLTKRKEASGISTAFTYSALDQLTQKTMTASGGSSPFASWSNTYDLAGNRLTETSVLPGDTYAGAASFSYDTVQRLQTAAQPTQASLTYGYDAAHNRTSVSGGTAPRGATSFAYLANEALNTETPTRQSTLPYSPDADGNITGDAAGHQLKYDSLNRLQEVRDSASNLLVSYAYDALGRLAKRTAGTAITQFFYRGLEDTVVQEQDGNNTVLRSYAWDLNGRRLSVQTGGSLYTVATNPHGDVVGLMTGAGSVVGWTHFDPWAQILGTSGTTIPFGFQGGFTDPLASFGFVRMGLRWYDPRQGRFVSEEPLGVMAKARQPLAETLWDYGLDNPMTYFDLLGLIAIHDNCYRNCPDESGTPIDFTFPPQPVSQPLATNLGSLKTRSHLASINSDPVTPRPLATLRVKPSSIAVFIPEGATSQRHSNLTNRCFDAVQLMSPWCQAIRKGNVNPVCLAPAILGGLACAPYDLANDNLSGLLGDPEALLGGGAARDVEEVAGAEAKALGSEKLESADAMAIAPKEFRPTIKFDMRQLQSQLDQHGVHFGIVGPRNAKTRTAFRKVLEAHVKDPDATRIEGTYRGRPAIHYLNPETRLNVFTTPDDVFWGAWQLGEEQLENVILRGSLR